MHCKIKRYILIGIFILVLPGIFVFGCRRQTGKENQPMLMYTEKTTLELPGRDNISFFKAENGDILFSVVDYEKEIETLSSLEGELLQISIYDEEFLDAVILPDHVYYLLMIAMVDGEEHLVVKRLEEHKESVLCYLDDFYVEGRDDCYQWKITAGREKGLVLYTVYGYREISEKGETLCQETWQEGANYDMAVTDKGVWYSVYESGYRKLWYHDRVTGEETEISRPRQEMYLWKMYVSEAGDFYLLADEGIFRYDDTEESFRSVLNWSDYGYEASRVAGLLQAGDDPVCLIGQDGHYEIITWHSDRIATRETIVLGGVGIYEDIRDYAARYNHMQEKYLIEIRDYGKDYAYEDQGLGLQDLYNAILAGNGPDIIAIDPENMDYTALMDKRALEDLRPYLEKSEVIREEDIILSIRELFTYQEQIGMLPTNFYISGWMMKRQYAEEQGSITTEMILRLLEEKQEEIDSGFSKSELLGLLYGSCDAGELLERIDSGELERALVILKDYPEDGTYESNWDLYPAGKIAFLGYTFMGVNDYLLGKAIWGEQGVYLTEKDAFPIEVYLRNCWGISSRSSHKDAAWSFIESFFTKEWMEEVTPNWAFSVNAEYFREQLEQALADKMFADSSPYMEAGSIAEVTREDIEWIHDLVYNARKLAGGSSQLLKIIEEEAGSYYAGDKTAGEASAIIRNRVNLYQEEQQ